MEKIKWSRVVVCGLGAGLAWSALSVPILVVFGRALIEAMPPTPLLGGVRFPAGLALNSAAGIWAIWLYAAIRPRYGAGPKAAALAGFSWWLIASIASSQWSIFGYIRFLDLLGLIVSSLPVLMTVTVMTASSYEGKAKSDSAREAGTTSALRG